MSDLQKHLQELLKDDEFRKEYEESRTEFEITKALIVARSSKGMTQKELSERTGIRQSNISRIENGIESPTIDTLQKLAKGLGMNLVISFE